MPLNNFHVWYVNSKDPWRDSVYNLVVAQMSENLLAKSALPTETAPEPDLRPKIYSVLRWGEVEKRMQKIHGDIYQLVSLTRVSEILSMNESTYVSDFSAHDSRKMKRRLKARRQKSVGKTEESTMRSQSRAEDPSPSSPTIVSRDTSTIANFESLIEEPLKPRWILLPTDSQRFRIRFQPEETGHYEETYALTIWDGNNTTYEVNVSGVADIPRLDMNPETIFPKTAVAKLTEADSSSYFYDRQVYDFGSLLILRKDVRAHYREARLKFCNVSKVDAEVRFWLGENSTECFSIEPQELFIAPGNCATLILSAVANRLGIITGKLYLCVRNNPKVDVIELQCEGSKLDIELEPKEFSFDRVLLYRMEYRTLTIRNKTPVSFYWSFDPEGEADRQIMFAPASGLIELRSEQNVDISYHALTVGTTKRTEARFKAFLDEDDRDPVFTDVVVLSGETYDVAVDINNANPIDLKYIKVDFPTRATFTMRNRGSYEVKYVITMQDNKKLATLNLPAHFKKKLEVHPASGTLPPRREQIVDVILKPKMEMTLKGAPILKCNLVDTLKETIVIAEIPLNISFVAYYTRFRVYPFPVVNFGTLAVCSEKTMYLNIENTGKFPLQYTIQLLYKHPSVLYMSNRPLDEDTVKKNELEKHAEKKSKKGKKKSARMDPQKLTLGPMTISKTEGEVAVGQTDSIDITCYPEFVGSQEEQIIIVVEDSVPEDREGKTITLSVNSSVPTIDFHDLDLIFQENHVVDQMQDFDCPKDIGPHTVFARQEKCLYFRFISVPSTHVTCFRLYNHGVVAASVDIRFIHEALMPSTAKTNTFVIDPLREQIPPMSHKVFTVSFTPHIIETFHGAFEVSVILPSHLGRDHLFIKLVGESCVPQVTITEPVHGVREWPTLNFPRTLIDESSFRCFVMENVGCIKAKVIVEIEEDLSNVFAFSACLDTQPLLQVWDEYCDEPHDRCTVVRLAPGNVGRFKVTFSPTQVGKDYGKIRLQIVDNPYENLMINLEGECYVELIVLKGLQLDDSKRKLSARQETRKSRKAMSKQTSLASATSSSMYPLSLTYVLDYELCFIGKMYKKTFSVINKSTDRWFRFQWSAHPHVVFEPSIGHIKYLTSKENVVTFLAGEPTNHENTRIECLICEITVEDPTTDMAWDDRQTEVKWEKIHPDLMHEISDVELMKKKLIAPTIEAKHEVIPGTGKSIQLLLSATVAYSEYLCSVQEIYFKDTLMFQVREYKFTLSNPGIVNTVYAWKVNMDEQYPKRHIGDGSSANSRPRTADDYSSVQQSRSSRGIFSAKSEPRYKNAKENEKSVGDSTNVMSRQCTSFASDSVDMKTASSTKMSDLFSSTAGMSERTTDSWLEGDDLPFSISPEIGIIPPGQSVESTLTFSPKDVFYYKAYLTCKMDNLDPKRATLTIPIMARSLLPYCHFDVQESDYVTSGRRDPTRPGPVGYEIDDPTLWQNIRVIEFKVVGVGRTHVKRFHLINPTVDDYRFSWRDRTPRKTDEISNFHCTVSEGFAERGKRTDLAFTFLAEDVGVFESFWLFSIERYNLECLFLVAGVVTEPSVHCLTVHVKLKPTILGFNVKDSIKLLNNEDCHLDFKIVEESLYSEGKYQKLSVTPMSGTLVPKSELYLWVEYHPTRVGEFHFSIQCAVNLMKSPLTIFVTASVYDIVSSVSYCKPNGEVVQASEDKENVIDLGRITLEMPVAIKFELTNTGKVSFYYTWDLGMTPEMECKNLYSLTMPHRQSHLAIGDRAVCSLTLTARQKVAIKDHCVLLQISNGPAYKFILKACSKRPGVDFSFNRYDFGPCYVQQNNAVSYYTDLCLTNTENVPFVIECAFEEQPHLSVDLNCISEALAPHSTISIPIVFRPLKETKYRDCLVFTINSTNEKKIMITGEGIGYRILSTVAVCILNRLQIRLVNPHEKSIDLGSVPPSKSVTKKIPVVNEGLAPVELKFDLMKDLNVYDEYRERVISCETKPEVIVEMEKASIMETKRSWTVDCKLYTSEPTLSEVLKIKPSTSITLKPNRKMNVLVTFKPTSRMKPFTAKVAAQTASTILPLFLLRGSCVGAEFRLNRAHIPFGTIVQGCSEETKVILMNTGDLGSRFKWNTSKLPGDFQITPMSGYCSAGMDVGFVVKFQPVEQRGLIEGEATIEIEKYETLKVKITGACSKLPQPIETIRFECLVREKHTRSVVVMNDSNLPWKLKPQVTGDYFSVDEILQIPPQQYAPCNVTYSPLVMNTENSLHTGFLVLKSLDDNLYLLYLLSGRSLPPQVVAKIVRQIPAKTKYTELLPVRNWLDTQQRFHCEIQLLKEDDDEEIPLHSFVGNERIDVPANSQRDYRAVFHCYKEWNVCFRVTFSNEEKEYQFYEIEYEVTEPEVIESIKLTTPARSQICYSLKLENPLEEQPVVYTLDCDYPFITIDRKQTKPIPPLSQLFVAIDYNSPLPAEESVMLNVFNEILGVFPYELRLKATPAPPEKVTRVSTTLGSSHAFSLSIKNLIDSNTKFMIELDSDSFMCPKSVQVKGLSDGIIEVVYEPCDVENVTATLVATSKVAGQFIFPLIGSCSLPRPMGPYVVTRTSSTVIQFKNVFREGKTFDFVVDVPAYFTVTTPTPTLESKQSIDVEIDIREDEMDGEESMDEKYPVTGKLIIYCTDPVFSHIKWIYYLRGVFDET
ncbi:hydrocephalus-inducing protein-like [Ceratina calcarata]|uniref:Hydrocephalus-inducing protein-like n=1 Tax=Ceratina calcarata TaxID=156304 RepID=A0AAJ7S2G5_9HYME|nr:hydrocephalus-inducing protein-like [Ceratina calcarata]